MAKQPQITGKENKHNVEPRFKFPHYDGGAGVQMKASYVMREVEMTACPCGLPDFLELRIVQELWCSSQ